MRSCLKEAVRADARPAPVSIKDGRPHPPGPPLQLRFASWRGWPFITFLSADLPSQTRSAFNLSKPLRGVLTPPTPLSSFAATPLVERGEPERACFLAPSSPRSIAQQCGAGEGGRGGEVGRAMRVPRCDEWPAFSWGVPSSPSWIRECGLAAQSHGVKLSCRAIVLKHLARFHLVHPSIKR